MNGIRRAAMRAAGYFRRRRAEARLNEEIRTHLDLLTEEHLRRGLPPEAARAAARRDFGAVAPMQEEWRDGRGWPVADALARDLRYAVRMLVKEPGFAAVAILTLAIGIGATTAIYSVADATLLNPLPFPHPDRLVTVNEIVPVIVDRPIRLTAPDLVDYQEQTRAFDAVAGWHPQMFELSGERESERVQGLRATASLFRVLQVTPALGRAFTEAEDRDAAPVCVIGDGLWRRWFGADPGVLGRTIHLDRVPYRIVGVLPRRFAFPISGMTDSGTATDLWVPMSLTPGERAARGDDWDYNGLARMKPGVTVAQASADVNAVAQHIVRDVLKGELKFTAVVRPLGRQVSGSVRPLVRALLGAVACVLLIACVNVANLLLVRGARRDKEIAMRAALGATRGRIVAQLVAETLLLALLASLGGGLLAWWTTGALGRFVPAGLAVLSQAGFNWRVLLFAAGTAAATALLVSVLPAIAAVGRLRVEALKQPGASASGVRHRRMRSALVVVEVALALVLLVGAGLLARTFRDLLDASAGFQAEGAVAGYVSLPTSQYPDANRERPFYRALHARLRALSNVEFAGFGTTLPLSGRRSERVFTPSDYTPPPDAALNIAAMTVVNSEYLQAIGATLVRGRYFTPQDDGAGEPVAIVTQSLARQYWAGRDPLGKRLKWGGGDWLTVVGVVGDVKLDSLGEPAGIQVYVPADQVERSTAPEYRSLLADGQLRSMFVVVRGRGPVEALGGALRDAVRGLDPRLAVSSLRPLADTESMSAAPQRFNMLLMGAFACVALLLAAVGIYGVTAYSVAQRTREIGIRMALGADPRATQAMVLRAGLGLVGIGLAIGAAAAAALAPALRALLFGVEPLDPITFAAVSLLLMAVTAAATYIPARRATKVDPMLALRNE
ncbi:MAG: ADOP family duplicated permease [Betaproteobacteria bacterium]